jgi:hypothetical protein
MRLYTRLSVPEIASGAGMLLRTPARLRETKSLESRTRASMARLAQRHGGQAEALKELAAVCEWFSEGLNTVDLIEARDLINQLS